MKTNLVKLSEDVYGKFLGDAMYCSGGTCQEDVEYDVANIYQLLNGTLIAEAYGILFPVENTNWRKDQLLWKYSMRKKRGRHSNSHNKSNRFHPVEIDELPF